MPAKSAVESIINNTKGIIAYFGGDKELLARETRRNIEAYMTEVRAIEKKLKSEISTYIEQRWFVNLPMQFLTYESTIPLMSKKVRSISDLNYRAGVAVVNDEDETLGYLEELGRLKEVLGNYELILDGIGTVTWENAIVGEVLAKKTLPAIKELGGDVKEYQELCKTLKEALF